MSSNQTPDPDAFRDFEHGGWTSNASEYEAAFARLTRQAVAPLLDAVNLRHGARLLDVATGPGYVAAAAAARGARPGCRFFRSDGCACPCDQSRR